jgi:2-phospho-L-lactate guanylyltransferase
MVLALIPVKSLDRSKSRLAGVLDADDRRALVTAMLRKVLRKCTLCGAISGVFIVTADRRIAAIAQGSGAAVIQEPASTGLNSAVDVGLEAARSKGHRQVLVLPADIPFLDQSELARIVDVSADGQRSVIVPCHKGDGTNALLIPSAARFTPQYGEASFWNHIAQLSELRLRPKAVRLAGIAADIDEPDDLALLSDSYRDSVFGMPAAQAVASHGDMRCQR